MEKSELKDSLAIRNRPLLFANGDTEAQGCVQDCITRESGPLTTKWMHFPLYNPTSHDAPETVIFTQLTFQNDLRYSCLDGVIPSELLKKMIICSF